MGIEIEFRHTDIPKWARYLLWFQAETLNKIGTIMASQDANTAAIEAVVTQLGKAKDEIIAKIAAVQAAADAGQDLTAPLADLTSVAQALDDIVPDAAPVEPVPVVEPVPLPEPVVVTDPVAPVADPVAADPVVVPGVPDAQVIA